MRLAIILAAGLSRRFGRRAKLLAPLAGRPLLAHAIARAKNEAERVILVTGANAAHTRRVARAAGIETVHAPAYRDGLSASLSAALRRVRPVDRQLLLLLGDMPLVPSARRWRLHGADAVRPIVDGQPGHPVLIRAAILRGARLGGDRGLAPLLAGRRIRTVPGGPGALLDLDTPHAFRTARGSWRRLAALARA
ncbi:NTP transferase domain-containing protein [Sphingomonas naphthae]|uniref:NTP transferase domain-containing protein n=1 Tax=Sphingomonas naphthae TaxID=1813468 RepID=A0ABY7TIW6_9SPHN|nr:NTP transferase domain-containing protein [Sphingomonas naphthae]WCT71829.1 NTP transferase domain-containing protein [Sphingomonas naphthae]